MSGRTLRSTRSNETKEQKTRKRRSMDESIIPDKDQDVVNVPSTSAGPASKKKSNTGYWAVSKETTGRKSCQDCLKMKFKKLTDIASQKNLDKALISGDLFTNKNSKELVAALFARMQEKLNGFLTEASFPDTCPEEVGESLEDISHYFTMVCQVVRYNVYIEEKRNDH